MVYMVYGMGTYSVCVVICTTNHTCLLICGNLPNILPHSPLIWMRGVAHNSNSEFLIFLGKDVSRKQSFHSKVFVQLYVDRARSAAGARPKPGLLHGEGGCISHIYTTRPPTL